MTAGLAMHGLINRSIQCFLHDTYGAELWQAVAQTAGITPAGFETMLNYDDPLTHVLVEAAALALGKPRDALLEDLGAFLVTVEPLRRLLRFGGVSYTDFLQSLDELPGRVQLAVPDLTLPQLHVMTEPGRGGFGRVTLELGCGGPTAGSCMRGRAGLCAGEGRPQLVPSVSGPACAALGQVVPPVLAGVLRGMADDYGALALIELHAPAEDAVCHHGGQRITVELLEDRYSEGRSFVLAQPARVA